MLLNCAVGLQLTALYKFALYLYLYFVRVGLLEKKTGFHYFILHRKPLHWDGLSLSLGTVALALAKATAFIVLGLGLGLERSGLVNITDIML